MRKWYNLTEMVGAGVHIPIPKPWEENLSDQVEVDREISVIDLPKIARQVAFGKDSIQAQVEINGEIVKGNIIPVNGQFTEWQFIATTPLPENWLQNLIRRYHKTPENFPFSIIAMHDPRYSPLFSWFWGLSSLLLIALSIIFSALIKKIF